MENEVVYFVGCVLILKSLLSFCVLCSGCLKYVNQQGGKTGEKNWQWQHYVKLQSMVSARLGKTGGYCKQHSPSITSLIPPLTGYHGNDCSSSVDPCVSNPCDPEGTLFCEELANTYRCVCQHGYTGTHCKTLINHCVDGLCQHGSVCVDLSREFKCDCLPGRFTSSRGLFQMEAIPPNEWCT